MPAGWTPNTRGNFRFLERLFSLINRVFENNQLDTIIDCVIVAATRILAIGC